MPHSPPPTREPLMDDRSAAHPPLETLMSFRLGQLDKAQAEEVGKHVSECPSCRNRVARIAPGPGAGARPAPSRVAPFCRLVAG